MEAVTFLCCLHRPPFWFDTNFNYGHLKWLAYLQNCGSNFPDLRHLWKMRFSKVAALFQVRIHCHLTEIFFLRFCFDILWSKTNENIQSQTPKSKQSLKKIISVMIMDTNLKQCGNFGKSHFPKMLQIGKVTPWHLFEGVRMILNPHSWNSM